MTMHSAQIVNYARMGWDQFYSELEKYNKGETVGYDWYMGASPTVGQLVEHRGVRECCLSMRKTTTVSGVVRTTYRINGKIVSRAHLAVMLYHRGAIE